MSFCPFCGVRQDVNLRQIHFRDLGTDASLPCPHCATPLDVIEFDTEPKVRIERCTTCYGTFFNPGELELLLDAGTNPLVWLDPVQLKRISEDFGYNHEVVYLKCPICSERMSHLNFGGSSGVIIDRCGTHGVWLEGSELRRLTEWWRAGGKLLYQKNEQERVKRMFSPPVQQRRTSSGTTIESEDPGRSGKSDIPGEPGSTVASIIDVVSGVLGFIAD